MLKLHLPFIDKLRWQKSVYGAEEHALTKPVPQCDRKNRPALSHSDANQALWTDFVYKEQQNDEKNKERSVLPRQTATKISPPEEKICLSSHGSRLPCRHGTSGENISPEKRFLLPSAPAGCGASLRPPFPPFPTSRLSSGPGLRRPAGGRGPFPGLRQGAGYVRHGRRRRHGFSRAPQGRYAWRKPLRQARQGRARSLRSRLCRRRR